MASKKPGKKRPEEIRRTPLRSIELTSEQWDEYEHGIRLFNEGKFWHSHEAWENVWIQRAEDERLFFQGLIQLAAGYHQIFGKKNPQGAVNNFDKAHPKLEVFVPEYLGLSVSPLLKFIEQGKKAIAQMSVGEEFDYNLVPKLQFHKPGNPDLLVEVKEVLGSAEFGEGLKLYQQGYHWEAHEAWEDVWRSLEGGDTKTFVQAFVQMASAYSFIKSCRLSSAIYLLEKSIEKFREFEAVDCGIRLQTLIRTMQEDLARMRQPSTNGNRPQKLTGPPVIEFKAG